MIYVVKLAGCVTLGAYSDREAAVDTINRWNTEMRRRGNVGCPWEICTTTLQEVPLDCHIDYDQVLRSVFL